jgi:pseudaminic acid biosynthesis-associated methylase
VAVSLTLQEEKWTSLVGRDYTDRNTLSEAELDELYADCFGVTRHELNTRFLAGVPRDANVLEVGCNIGMQLRHLQRMGFQNLSGIEVNQYAIDHLCVDNVDVMQGSVYDLPYSDAQFDLVFTSGVLIHLPLHMIGQGIREIVRVSNKWIWGFEYFTSDRQEIADRNWKDMLWSDDYPNYFLYSDPFGLTMVRRWSEMYRRHLPGTVADMYLLERK